MVAGKLDDFRAKLFAAQFNSFVATCHIRLSVGQWGRLKDDWDRAAAFISQNLKVRLQFYESLPWVILGGAHPEPQTARSCLERALGLWEKLPEEAKHLQHKLATDLFMPGPLLDDLQRFLSGEELEDCPCLEPYLAPLCFVPIAERIIEGAHKDLGEVSNKTSMTALSIEMRASELNRTLSLQPDLFQKLLECFVITRAVTKISSIFPCFQNHPLLVGLRGNSFSPQGSRMRWLHFQSVSCAIWMSRSEHRNIDFLVQECSHCFNTESCMECFFSPANAGSRMW